MPALLWFQGPIDNRQTIVVVALVVSKHSVDEVIRSITGQRNVWCYVHGKSRLGEELFWRVDDENEFWSRLCVANDVKLRNWTQQWTKKNLWFVPYKSSFERRKSVRREPESTAEEANIGLFWISLHEDMVDAVQEMDGEISKHFYSLALRVYEDMQVFVE